jgi:hypothetical protein
MKDLIKTVALEVANTPRFNDIGEATLTGFATVFLAELSKRAEAVGYLRVTEKALVFMPLEPTRDGTRFCTFPPIRDIETIENSVAEACASLAYETLDDTFLSGHGYATNISEAIRSGEWRKYK